MGLSNFKKTKGKITKKIAVELSFLIILKFSFIALSLVRLYQR